MLHFASDQQLSVLSPALHSHDIDIDQLTAGGYSHREGIMSRAGTKYLLNSYITNAHILWVE